MSEFTSYLINIIVDKKIKTIVSQESEYKGSNSMDVMKDLLDSFKIMYRRSMYGLADRINC